MSLLRPSPQPSLRPPPGAGHTLVLSVTPADGDSAPTLGSHQGLGRVGWTQRRVGAEPEHATHRDGLARLQPSPPASSVPPARAAHQAGRPHCPQADVSPSPAAAASAGRRHRRRPTTWLSPPVRGRDTDHQVSDHGSHGRGTVPPPPAHPLPAPAGQGHPRGSERTARGRPPMMLKPREPASRCKTRVRLWVSSPCGERRGRSVRSQRGGRPQGRPSALPGHPGEKNSRPPGTAGLSQRSPALGRVADTARRLMPWGDVQAPGSPFPPDSGRQARLPSHARGSGQRTHLSASPVSLLPHPLLWRRGRAEEGPGQTPGETEDSRLCGKGGHHPGDPVPSTGHPAGGSARTLPSAQAALPSGARRPRAPAGGGDARAAA